MKNECACGKPSDDRNIVSVWLFSIGTSKVLLIHQLKITTLVPCTILSSLLMYQLKITTILHDYIEHTAMENTKWTKGQMSGIIDSNGLSL